MTRTLFQNHAVYVGEGFALRRTMKALIEKGLAYSLYCELPEVGFYPDGGDRIYCMVVDYTTMVDGVPMVHWLSASDGLEFFQRHWHAVKA